MSGSGTVLVQRYRLEERLSGPDPLKGSLWRAVDVMAGDLPVAIRQLETPQSQERLQVLWPQLQALLHPQVPRCGELLELDGSIWLIRDWQDGVTYDVLLEQRRFAAGEVLQLMRQILPVLALLHGCGLVHGELNPRHLLRRRSDGLPVLLEAGVAQREGVTSTDGPWRELHDLGVTALVLLGGTASDDGGWPKQLELDAGFRQVLERLLSEEPERRFSQASEVLKALEEVALPASEPDGVSVRTSRALAREQGAEGRLWPVVIALALSALVGSAIGWFLLPRSSTADRASLTGREGATSAPSDSLPPVEFDQRQQLFSRLRALQVDRSWFLKLVDASLLNRFPERADSPPTKSSEDAQLRRVWTELAKHWLARIEQLRPAIRARLGRLGAGDWEQPRQSLVQQGIHPDVVEQLVSASSQLLLPEFMQDSQPAEPFRQLWIAAAMQNLDDVEIVRLKAGPLEPTNTSLRIPAGGARLVLVEVPEDHVFALGINGTPLMQMLVFGAKGQVVEQRGPLRVVRIPADVGLPLHVLVTNEGVSSSAFTLSCLADPMDQ
ncbi:serine/threonine protein kinase [Synechococcus sp. RS9902]|uniref:serine/threonine protein kinase n=1 Tax=Synechococcus sp. RS9902 TaxID=221345 RepID=UPI001861CEDD|nr:serine/threonine protein kinase [Synechococcus sp. RS9902]QNI96049.1 serine/threonine protein kinase [Synechococcus sp. RS9902]